MRATYLVLGLLVAASASAQLPQEMLETVKEYQLPTLVREDVSRELNLSAAQRQKIASLVESDFKGGGKPPSFVPKSMIRSMVRKKIGALEASCVKQLDPAQKTRLGELWRQWRGGTLVYRKEVREGLELSQDQLKAIDRISEKASARRSKQKSDPFLIDHAESEELFALLTSGQRKKMESGSGKLFQFSSQNETYAKLPKP